MKPMHPTKFLWCNSWTLPFPIPAGGQGPAGLQSARSRAGPAGQSSGFWPLDLQRTLGCLGKPRGSDLSAKGWSGQGLEPQRRGLSATARLCQQRADYVVPCSTQSQFPDLWSAPLRRAHWMPTLGDTGAHAMGVPSRHGDPREDNGEPLPYPRQERPPPRAAPPLPCSRCLPSRSGDPRSTTGTAPHPRHDPIPDPRRPASPRPGRAPGALPTFTTGSR